MSTAHIPVEGFKSMSCTRRVRGNTGGITRACANIQDGFRIIPYRRKMGLVTICESECVILQIKTSGVYEQCLSGDVVGSHRSCSRWEKGLEVSRDWVEIATKC